MIKITGRNDKILNLIIMFGSVLLTLAFFYDLLNSYTNQDIIQFGIDFLAQQVNVIQLITFQIYGITFAITLTAGGVKVIIK